MRISPPNRAGLALSIASTSVIVLLSAAVHFGSSGWFNAGLALQSLLTLCWTVLATSESADPERPPLPIAMDAKTVAAALVAELDRTRLRTLGMNSTRADALERM